MYVFPHTQNTNVGSVVGNDGWPGVIATAEFKGGLFNMYRDPGEQYDMSEVYPEIAEDLRELADQKRKELGDARMKIEGSEIRESGQASGNNIFSRIIKTADNEAAGEEIDTDNLNL